MMNLEDKVVLITGAAGGIGRQAAIALGAAGAQVIATDIDMPGLATLAADGNGRIRTMRQDVADPDHWSDVIGSIGETEQRLDVLVNNAGVILNRSFAKTSLEAFRHVQRVNVESVWLGMQHARPLMTTSAATTAAGGSIINMSSIYGLLAGPNHAAYCASKGAVRLMTKAVAVEFADPAIRIRVNSLHPGPIETGLGVSGVEEAVNQGRMADVESGKKLVAERFPMKRWGTPEDIAGPVLFLASDLSRFMTGAELTIDGGYTIL